MFEKGTYVAYGSKGICRIEGITNLKMGDVPKDKQFYVLSPAGQEGTIYVAVEAGEEKMRPMITREEAEELIKSLKEIEPVQVTNDKEAEEIYKQCIRQYDCKEWARLIKCIYQRSQERITSGKKTIAKDEKYMHMAERALYSELALALAIPKDQVLDYILEKLEG